MAQVDVSELLLDPDFVSDMLIIRRSFTVSTRGKTQITEGPTVTTVGSVQPAPAKELVRLPEALRMQDVKAFFVRAEISPDSAGSYPDVLSFGGRRFQVISAESWMNYGAGWTKGLCIAEKPSNA